MMLENRAACRRQFLKKSLLGSSAVGIGTLGVSATALAANSCTDSSGNYSNLNEVWSLPGYDSANTYDCNNPVTPYYKVEHATGMIYMGSCWDGNSWDHEFHTTSHAEHFSRQYCPSSWERSAGLDHQKATIKNESPSSISIPAPSGEMVKANPPLGNSSSPSDLLDYAFTGATIALSGYNFWAGAASSIIATYVNNLGNQTKPDPDTIVHDWDYDSQFYPCAGHYIQTEIEGNGSGSGSDFDFDQIHEAWGKNPTYTDIHYRISIDDSTCSVGCDCSGAPSSASTTYVAGADRCESASPASLSIGDVMKDSNGNDVEVSSVDTTVIETAGSKKREVEPENLQGAFSEKYAGEETVIYREFPMRISRTVISGKLLD